MSQPTAFLRFPEVDPPLAEANAHLAHVLYTRKVQDAQGKTYDLKAEISRSEGWFMRELILKDPTVTSVLEVGCATGISSMFLASALAGREGARHVIVDPNQISDWLGIGKENMRKAGFDFATFLVEPSEIALPRLLAEGQQFDFVFIDGMHTFDHCMVDAFFANRLVRPGGYIAFDDVDCLPVHRVIRYVSNYPHLKLIGCAGRPYVSRARALLTRMKRWMAVPVRLFPDRLRGEMFDDTLVRPDARLALDSSLLVFQKTGPDTRSTEWYQHF